MIRALAVAAALLAGGAYFAELANRHYPVEHWLLWRYLACWVACAVWSVSCLATGHRIVQAVLGRTLRFGEQMLMAQSVGVFAFFVLTFVAGLLGLFGWGFFLGAPLLMCAVGGRSLFRYIEQHRRRPRRKRALSTYGLIATGFGLVVLVMCYFLILLPQNSGFDALWKHYAIGERYALLGGIEPFREGWYPGTAPHLASVLYAWAFQAPWATQFDQIELAAHLEFTVFLWTLFAANVLAERCLGPGVEVRWGWVVRLTFPGVLLYGSTLNGGSDHIAALWMAPIFLMALDAARTLSPRYAALLAVSIAGAVMTKYSSAIMVAFIPLCFCLMCVVDGARARLGVPRRWVERGGWWKAPVCALAVGLVCTAPHWLKNWVWYGDPLYPLLHRYLDSAPWSEQANNLFKNAYSARGWEPAPGLEGLLESFKVLFTFSFYPHDWPARHGDWPVFGSLFTLTSVALPFLRSRHVIRVWALVGFVLVCLFGWYQVHHQDRHLQTLMPLMGGATAALMVLIWRLGRWPRIALCGVIAWQIGWGADTYFIGTHAMLNSAPAKHVVDLLGTGYERKYEKRLRPFAIGKVGESLPEGSRAVVHEVFLRTGLGVPFVDDHPGFQALIDYGRLATPGAVWDLYRELGVTHLVWVKGTSTGWGSLAHDLIFFYFALHHTTDRKSVGSAYYAAIADSRPQGFVRGDGVVFSGCDTTYVSGLYRLGDLTMPAMGKARPRYPKPRKRGEPSELLKEAAFAVVDLTCKKSLPSLARENFEKVAVRKRKHPLDAAYESTKGKTELWIRR